MSGIVGLFPGEAAWIDEAVMQLMLDRMSARGTGHSAIWRAGGAALAVTRNRWESDPAFSGAALVVRDGDLAVAADASLYYRSELERKLAAAGVRVLGTTPSHLIVAAYRVWGEECVRYLEGDYAFILWDAARRQVFCARDFAGSRPLFYAEVGRALVVASTLGALRAYPGCRGDFNVNFLAECAANLWLSPSETAYASLHAIPAGFSLSRTAHGTTILARHWRPPQITTQDAPPFEEAATELRSRLVRAAEERIPLQHPTAVFLSGGRDSSAVFASGQAALQGHPVNGRRLAPISISYPPGDVGREDELIGAIVGFWGGRAGRAGGAGGAGGAPIRWLDIRDIPFFERPEGYAAQRDEPWALPYVSFNRALAAECAAVGAHVAFDGWGGDQLFQMSPAYLADLFRAGRWMALAREWRALKVRDFRYFFRMTITPSLPPSLRALAALLRGGRPLPLWPEAGIAGWISAPLARRLKQRQRSHIPAGNTGSFANDELYTLLTSASMSRARGWLSDLALRHNVEVRFPLYDPRVIELAVRRPPFERRSGRQTKMLLRAAMRGLLPDHVLADRAQRTGVTDHYLRNSMRAHYLPLLERVLRAPIVLADLGIVEPAIWRRSAENCLREEWNPNVGMALCFTLHTELWLRARMRHSNPTMATSWPSFRASRPGSPLTTGGQRVHQTEARTLRDSA